MPRKIFFKEFHPIVYVLILGSVLMNIGFGMIVPFFAIYLLTYTGLGSVAIGFIVGASSIGTMLGGFLGGTLSDQYGRKKIMLISLVVTSLVYGGFVFHSFPLLLLSLTLVMGFCKSFFDPCAKALIADFTEASKRMKAFSMRYIGVNIGFAIGPLLGICLGVTPSSRIPFFLTSLILLGYALILYRCFLLFNVQEISIDQQEKAGIHSSFKAVRGDVVLLLFLLGGLMATSVHGQFSVILSQYFEVEFKEGLPYLMLLWSIHSTVIIILGLPIVKIMEKLKAFKSIVCGTTLFALGIIGFAFSFNFWTFCVSMIVFTIGEVFLLPAEYAIIDEITPDRVRGTYYGAISFTHIGSFFGPGISGFLLLTYNGLVMFLALAATVLGSILFYYLGQKKITDIYMAYNGSREMKHN